MRQILLLAGLVMTSLACSALAGDKGKGTKVDLDGLVSTTPSDWVPEKPASSLRKAQFRLPRAKDDKDNAELALFQGITGSADQNISRWKAQFIPPRGKTRDDVSKVTEIKIAGMPATMLVIEGTYAPPSFNPRVKAKQYPGYKMIAIQFDGPKEIYHIKLTGPAKTVEHHRKAFEAWIKAFK
jgi:hypothetical protein